MSTIHLSEEQFRVLGLSFEPEGTFGPGVRRRKQHRRRAGNWTNSRSTHPRCSMKQTDSRARHPRRPSADWPERVMVGRDSRPATRQAQGTLERLRTEYEGVSGRTTRLTSLTEGLGGKEQTVRDLLREIEASGGAIAANNRPLDPVLLGRGSAVWADPS